jgi:hypothetical protein
MLEAAISRSIKRQKKREAAKEQQEDKVKKL